MKSREKSYRLYSCGRCANQVRICRDCDRGNRYCAGECAQMGRRESLRRAGERYQLSYRGACNHAARSRALRKRCAQEVTHQGSQASAVALIVVPTSTTAPSQGTDEDTPYVELQAHTASLETPRCCFCGCVLPRFARLGPLRAGP